MASVKMEVLQLRDNEYDNGRMPASDFATVDISVTHLETYTFRFSVSHPPVIDESDPPPVEVRVSRVHTGGKIGGTSFNEALDEVFSYELEITEE